MDFLFKHKSFYGFDRKVTYIKDKLFDLLKDNLSLLGFEHVVDNEELLIKEVNLTNKPGYGLIDGNKFILCENQNNNQKARERIFEVLCSFRLFLEHLGRFVMEYSSIDDSEFYLLANYEKTYKIISSYVKEEYILIVIEEDIIELICDYYLHSSLRKEKAGLIIFDEKQSIVSKVKKQLLEYYPFYISSNKEDIKSENMPYCLILTHSLAKRNEVKLVSFLEDFEKNINVDELKKYLDLYDLKVNNLIFKDTLNRHINNSLKSTNLCVSCASKEKDKFFVVKDFTQKLNLKKCDSCSSFEGVLTYTLINKSH